MNRSIIFFYKNAFIILLISLTPVVLWSAIEPKRIGLWILETSPFFIGMIAILKSYKHFPLTPFTYLSIFIGSVLVLIGAHYSYSHVPFCDLVKNSFGFTRNNFDKIGHFFQGFVTAVITKEFLYRKKIMNSRLWMNFFTISFSIALSAVYEIFEWFGVVFLIFFNFKKSSADFLGAQGYRWDTQSDMFLAAIGAIIAIVIFGKYHEKKIKHFLSIKYKL